jgi:hypothetical protein
VQAPAGGGATCSRPKRVPFMQGDPLYEYEGTAIFFERFQITPKDALAFGTSNRRVRGGMILLDLIELVTDIEAISMRGVP